jgi:hypothetical protein
MLRAMRFHDRHEHLRYLKLELAARRIEATPGVIREARVYIERFWRDDPHAAHQMSVWNEILQLHPSEVARRLLEDSPAGRYLRETAPPFGVTTAREVAPLIEQVRADWAPA